MRITAEAKNATGRRILEAAVELFKTKGFDATTTRDIAGASQIATGTLFNYFDTKEAIVAALAEEAYGQAHEALRDSAARGASLEEDLFALVAAELRQLKRLRKYISPLLETVLSPLAAGNRNAAEGDLRSEHLALVAELGRRHGFGELSTTALHLYWALYTGVLAFWAADKSPKQEDTLALVDQSLAMFVLWLRGQVSESPVNESQ